jgi:hypothetical protein
LHNNNKGREEFSMEMVPLDPGFAAELRGVTIATAQIHQPAMGEMP